MASDALFIQAYDNIVLAKITKDRLLDAGVINDIGAVLLKMLDRYAKPSVVLDLSDVGYASSAFLGKLIALYKGVTAAKGRMTITGVKPALKPLFQATKLDKMIPMADDAEQVILAYRRKPL